MNLYLPLENCLERFPTSQEFLEEVWKGLGVELPFLGSNSSFPQMNCMILGSLVTFLFVSSLFKIVIRGAGVVAQR